MTSDSVCFAAEANEIAQDQPAPAKSTENAAVSDPAKPAVSDPTIAPPLVAKLVAKGSDGIPLVTNIFYETDLQQALSDISAQTGVSILADSTVQGNVSVDLKDMELEKALTMLLMSGGYAFTKLDGYYLVGQADPSNPNFFLLTKTEYFELRHTSPQVIISLLTQPYGRYLSAVGASPQTMAQRYQQSGSNRSYSTSQTTSTSGTVPGVPDLYGIVITAPPCMMSRIKADITALDKPPLQVMLDVVIVELNQDALKDLGVDWATRWLSQDLTSVAANLVYSTVANNEIAKVTALVQNGRGKLRANPRLATVEGQTAELEVGKETYFSIVTGPVTYPYATIETIKSGIFLRVTPRVIEPEGEIVARIEPEVRDVTGKGANGLPEITFRRAITNLRVKNGESIVIGGLINEVTSSSVSKVPLLGDIPLIGGLFRRKSTQQSKTEVIIIVTPHIITDASSGSLGSPAMKQEVLGAVSPAQAH